MPNNPPTPVLESIAVAIHSEEDCEAVKAKYGIKTRQHRGGANTSGNRVPSDKGLESHHILQDKAMVGIVTKYNGHAVLLDGATKGEHDIINASQIERNCPGPGPANFGELQKTAKADISNGLQKGERQVPKEDADRIADCIVVEAVVATQEKVEKGKRGGPPGEYLQQSSPVSQVKGCIHGDVLVWLDKSDKIEVRELTYEHSLLTDHGTARVLRLDACNSVMYEIEVDGESIAIAAAHRVQLATGQYIRVESLGVGHKLSTAFGITRVKSITKMSGYHLAYNVGIGRHDTCRIGKCGVLVELSDVGPQIITEKEIASAV